MKCFKLFLLLSLLSVSNFFAHQDFWTTKTFGKVKVRIKTGFHYEEINKVWIIGELASKLAITLKFNDTIFLDFEHHYTSEITPDYFISYDDGSIKESWSGGDVLRFLEGNALVVREVARTFDAAATLKLLEYAFNHLGEIKQTQTRFLYNKNYCQWLINSIDTAKVRQISRGPLSALIKGVMNTKIYCPQEEKHSNSISYFFRNNKYHFFHKGYNFKDSVLFVVDNIYQIKVISFNEAIVFETDNTFFYVRGLNNPHVSKRWIIEDKSGYFEPYEIARVGGSKVTISFWYYSKGDDRTYKKRTLIYRSDKDKLTQDLDKLFEK